MRPTSNEINQMSQEVDSEDDVTHHT